VKNKPTDDQPCVFRDKAVHELLLKYDLRAERAEGMPGVFSIVDDSGMEVAIFPYDVSVRSASCYFSGNFIGFRKGLEKGVKKDG